MLKKVILCPNPYRDHELTVAKEASMSDYVVEWAGGPILSIRKGFDRATGSAILQGIARRVVDGTASSAQARQAGAGARPMAELAWKHALKAGARSV